MSRLAFMAELAGHLGLSCDAVSEGVPLICWDVYEHRVRVYVVNGRPLPRTLRRTSSAWPARRRPKRRGPRSTSSFRRTARTRTPRDAGGLANTRAGGTSGTPTSRPRKAASIKSHAKRAANDPAVIAKKQERLHALAAELGYTLAKKRKSAAGKEAS